MSADVWQCDCRVHHVDWAEATGVQAAGASGVSAERPPGLRGPDTDHDDNRAQADRYDQHDNNPKFSDDDYDEAHDDHNDHPEDHWNAMVPALPTGKHHVPCASNHYVYGRDSGR